MVRYYPIVSALLVGILGAGTLAVPISASAQNGCHSSYIGWCVPDDGRDVDCLGGTGNGPHYVGRVIVDGPDVFRLDHDRNGIGCEESPTGPLWPG